MIDKYQEIDMSALYDSGQRLGRLGDVAYLVPGYYSKYSRIFTLKECREISGSRIEGFSAMLGRRVTIERSAVRVLVNPKDVKDFLDADYQQYSTFLVTADYNAPNFAKSFPLAAEYLRECMVSLMGYGAKLETILRPHIREAMDRKKVVLSTAKNICQSMLDAERNVVPTVGAYMCSFPHDAFQNYPAYMAILNSRVFSYVFYHRMKAKDNEGWNIMEILENMPIPYISNDFEVLRNVSECLLYLMRPDVPFLFNRMPNARIAYYLTKIMDMVVYELYFPRYMHERRFEIIPIVSMAPFMYTMIPMEDRIRDTYEWFQRPDNFIRQQMELLDTRSPELLYKIQTFNPNE